LLVLVATLQLLVKRIKNRNCFRSFLATATSFIRKTLYASQAEDDYLN